MIVDTQIISYCFSGHWEAKEAKSAEISSVTASEFLLFHTRENDRVDYYVLDPERYPVEYAEALALSHGKNPKWAKMGSKRTDSLIIDFSKDYESYRMFGNGAITSIINDKKPKLFKASITHLNKKKRKLLTQKMEFILDNEIVCHRINERICEIGMDLFEKFGKNLSPKDNIKNTINDLLILSTSIEKRSSLLTEDKVLGAFAAEIHNGQMTDYMDGVIVDFSSTKAGNIVDGQESKGYINRGWAYSFRKGNL